ncbi:MAG: sodium:proton antiporter [Chloroherpetonaceae bacterium]|nr:sodium:proton antiporter [Chloroherpetonaceae bacterium]
MPVWSLIPFIVMLGSIAVLPLIANHFWESNRNKLFISLILSFPIAIFLILHGEFVALEHAVLFDYIPFVILLGALFVITGGIRITGDIEATPQANTAFMAIGALLASFIGTTGASMLLIRALLQTNQERKFKVHTVLFFIGIVANCGGLLTPLGDPPLFVLYLRGVPFDWFFKLFPLWGIANGALLLLYFIIDSYFHSKEPLSAIQRDRTQIQPIRVKGVLNFVWLLGVVLSVAFFNEQFLPHLKALLVLKFGREFLILLFAGLSMYFTEKKLRIDNNFSWAPILEVAYLFLGIFITMIPCILFLEANAKSIGVESVRAFYYATGSLSAVLDNTPTAVTFYSLALGLGLQDASMIAGVPDKILESIAVASVLFGSLTYIGNGPNFMVKAIAEENGIRMPDFFSYIYRFSLVALLPIFILLQLIFF